MKNTVLNLFICLELLFALHPNFIEADECSFSLNATEERDLCKFLHAMMWDSQLGYVLFGNKPMCFESFSAGYQDMTGKLFHHLSITIYQGVKTWEKLNFPRETEKYLFIINQNDECTHQYSHVLFINKEAFYSAFNENEALFRYVLGPDLTADMLLDSLKNQRDSFFSILKYDKVLLGILLGFGLENALYVSRAEQIREELDSKNSQKPGNFPVIKLIQEKINLIPFRHPNILPSIPHSKIENELEYLEKTISFSSEILENYFPQLTFGKVDKSNTSTKIIEDYETNQKEIITILDMPNWLEKVLNQFYGKEINLVMINDKEEKIDRRLSSSFIVSESIFDSFTQLDLENEEINFQKFLKGMEGAEQKDALYIAPFIRNRDYNPDIDDFYREGFIIWSFYKNCDGLYDLGRVIRNLKKMKEQGHKKILTEKKNRQLSEIQYGIFNHIDKNEHFQALKDFNSNDPVKKVLFKDKLYYHQKCPGNGSVIVKEKPLKISYTLYSIYRNVIEDNSQGVVIDLKRTFRGFRESLPNMSLGEKGILYIHPDWGIKNDISSSNFSPYLIAEFEIISQ